ncbi:MAG: peptidoglycan DD-metalloendopeptidase family protein [Ruminococcus sp.]|nr:peptidoglycan DD-metalloendopeptidase family protein [Ruminococcus sp.]
MKKIISICLAIVIVICAIMSTTAATISELEARQAELEAQQAEYQQKLNDSNAAVSEQQEEVDALVGQVESVTEEIQVCYQKIAIYDADIAEKQTAIDAANAEIEANMETLRQRIKTIYISGDVSALEIVLGAKDFSDFLDKIQLVQYVSNHDEELINGIKTQLDAISDEKAALEADKADLEAEQATLTAKQDELNTLLEENKETLASLQSDAADAQMQLNLSEQELSGLSEEIQDYYRQQREALEAQQAAAAAAAASGGNDDDDDEINYNSTSNEIYYTAEQQVETDGSWTWPLPGNYMITSQYGEGRSYETHNALDIGAYIGEPIYAANSGTVVSSNNSCPHTNSGGNWCSCGGGYGNFVWILHDNGYETIYGHMIQTTVSTGQYVSNGQLIGYAGSSGWSTGCHLHFELRINGIKSNPWNLY